MGSDTTANDKKSVKKPKLTPPKIDIVKIKNLQILDKDGNWIDYEWADIKEGMIFKMVNSETRQDIAEPGDLLSACLALEDSKYVSTINGVQNYSILSAPYNLNGE